MGADADSGPDQIDAVRGAPSTTRKEASSDPSQSAAVDPHIPHPECPYPETALPRGRPRSSPSRKSPFTRGQGLQEAQLKPLQDVDFEIDFSLPPPHPQAAAVSPSKPDSRTASTEQQHAEPATSKDSQLTSDGAATLTTSAINVSPFALSDNSTQLHSLSSSTVPGAGSPLPAPEATNSEGGPVSSAEATPKQPDGQASSSLQPATPPLQTPSGQTPVSRPASVQEGEEASSSGSKLQGIAKGIQAAIERQLSVAGFRRHPTEDMEDAFPPLRSVAAEIETPAQSPRSGAASPAAGAPPSGDSFTRAFMHQARRLRGVVLNQKVNFSDVAQNPRLARAARAELNGHAPGPNAFAGNHTASASRPHDAEVERQRAVLLSVDTEAEQESAINRELAHVMCARLDAARRATERLLGVLQACANAEAAYTRTLTAASKVKLVGDCDGASVRGALDGFSDLPFMVGQAHATIGAGLSDTTKSMQEVVTALRLACIEISSESGKVHKAIDSTRRGLHSAFVDHQSTCRMTDDSALERARGRAARPFLEAADPWLTEARVVAAHGALHKAQAMEREFLTRAFAVVKDLELRRIAAIRSVVAAFAEAYKWGLSAVKADTAPLLSSVEEIDGEADLEELTASSEAAVETGATLAARQADALEAASQELLCSPDITKQGEMARWVSGSGRWMDCHCVLTRCGFLHWFAGNPPDPADIVPADSLSLARCQFETGEAQAQEFNLIEVAAGMFGRSRRLIFKASSMEECCEWAIVLREAIAECSRK